MDVRHAGAIALLEGEQPLAQHLDVDVEIEIEIGNGIASLFESASPFT